MNKNKSKLFNILQLNIINTLIIISWTFLSALVGFSYKSCQVSKEKEILKYKIIKEINTRFNFAQNNYRICKDVINNGYTYGSNTEEHYRNIFANFLTPNPVCNSIDSIDYCPDLRDKSMPNLLLELKYIDKKYEKDINRTLCFLDSLKDYYKTHKNLHVETFYHLSNLINDSLKPFDLED